MAAFTRLFSSVTSKCTLLPSHKLLKYYFPSALLHCSKRLLAAVGQEIKMPSLSPTMTEGTIIRWLKKEGDLISPGDVLCEIQTDKAVVGFEVEDEGILAKILVPNDSKDIKIGTVIGLMVDTGEDWQDVEVPTTRSLEKVSVAGIEIKMPSLSPTMIEGTIVKWLKKEGDHFSPGDALCEIQTDKAIVAFEVEEEGILAKILVTENSSNIKIGTVIALMVNEGEDWKNVTIPINTEDKKSEEAIPDSQKDSSPIILHEEAKESLRLCGPAVKRLLLEYGIKHSLVTATGPHNVLLKGDILKYIDSKKIKPKSHFIEKELPTVSPVRIENYIDIPHTSMRQTIAKRLTLSKTTIPHAYMSIECIMDEVLKLRKVLKDQNCMVSVNDFIIKCASNALANVPEVNVINSNNEIKKMQSIDISVAVATEKGLITPIVKQANMLGVQQISENVKHLAAKAKAGKLKPEEYQGGSFAISNLGMFGISEFSAIISPPQGAILAVGTSRLVYTEEKPITKLTVTLSFDGRVITDNSAAKFLQCFKENLERPFAMIINSSKIN